MAQKTKKINNLGGRPAFVPTEEARYTVETMAAIGIGQTDIARVMRLDEKTLRKHFREELDCGRIRAITKIADSLMRQAMAGNIGAACFYLKTQAGWREKIDVNHAGHDGGALKSETTHLVVTREIVGRLDDSQRNQIREIAGALARRPPDDDPGA